jgi:hypothetical protein
MYIPCIDMACTISRFYEHVYRETKKMLSIKIWTHDLVHTRKLPWPLRHQRDCSDRIVAWHVSCFTLEVSDVRQAQDQPRASPCHERAGQWINMSTNRFKAQAAQPGALPPLARGTPGPFPGCLRQTLLTERRCLSHGGPSARAGPSWGHNKTVCVGRYLNQNIWQKKT